jgi:hypothetical protein
MTHTSVLHVREPAVERECSNLRVAEKKRKNIAANVHSVAAELSCYTGVSQATYKINSAYPIHLKGILFPPVLKEERQSGERTLAILIYQITV